VHIRIEDKEILSYVLSKRLKTSFASAQSLYDDERRALTTVIEDLLLKHDAHRCAS
jgi:hypothetical protein